jgi:hypothetical protein
VTYRLFVALMEINPVKLLISLCISKVNRRPSIIEVVSTWSSHKIKG